MTRDFPLPAVTDDAAEITIVTWLKSPGDSVHSGEVLLEVMTEKVNVEVQCDLTGKLAEIVRPAGSEVKVGDVVARLDITG